MFSGIILDHLDEGRDASPGTTDNCPRVLPPFAT
jgi:hypothetical protein